MNQLTIKQVPVTDAHIGKQITIQVNQKTRLMDIRLVTIEQVNPNDIAVRGEGGVLIFLMQDHLDNWNADWYEQKKWIDVADQFIKESIAGSPESVRRFANYLDTYFSKPLSK